MIAFNGAFERLERCDEFITLLIETCYKNHRLQWKIDENKEVPLWHVCEH